MVGGGVIVDLAANMLKGGDGGGNIACGVGGLQNNSAVFAPLSPGAAGLRGGGGAGSNSPAANGAAGGDGYLHLEW